MVRRGPGVLVLIALLSAIACGGPATNGATGSSPAASPSTPSTSALPRGVVAEIEVGDGPCASVEAFGSLWVTAYQAGTIERIDPETNEVVRSIEDEATVCGIVPAGD